MPIASKPLLEVKSPVDRELLNFSNIVSYFAAAMLELQKIGRR